mmetsp:Transcript_93253/g.216726  ORF Transcript_93253/g.216726 Transcript_93253/m.216726 type:complete len:217 (+) Transcript_93253:449-1099(+)
MKDEKEGLGAAHLFREVLLERVQQVGLQLHVAGFVDAVHIAKGSSDGELLGDRGQGVPHQLRVLGCAVELVLGHPRVVHAVLHAACDSDLHLQYEVHGCHLLEVLCADGHVLLVWLLGEVQHVRAEEWLAVHLKVLLVGLEHAIEPGQELLRAMVRVHEHRNAVGRRDVAHEVCAGAGAEDRSFLLAVGERLACKESRTALRELDHDRAANLCASL